jgi:hypothetical protein
MIARTKPRHLFKPCRMSYDPAPVQAGSHDDLWVERTLEPEALRADLGQGRLVDLKGTSLEQVSLNQILCQVRRCLQREVHFRAVA